MGFPPLPELPPVRTRRGTPIERYRHNVGKRVDNHVYVHMQYASEIVPEDILAGARARMLNVGRFEPTCLRYDLKTHAVRFDEAPEFDREREPCVFRFFEVLPPRYDVISSGVSQQIWHHKWMWVKDTYAGFDVYTSRAWSGLWTSVLPGVASGSERLWAGMLRRNGLEVTELLRFPNWSWRPAHQFYSSRTTAIRYPDPETRAPVIFSEFRRKSEQVRLGPRNLDLGGGPYDDITQWLAPLGVTNLVYDPYARSPEENMQVQRAILEQRADTVTVSNVLNVIKESDIRLELIATAWDSLLAGGTAYFSVYSDGGSKEDSQRDVFQSGRNIKAYLSEIYAWFGPYMRLLNKGIVKAWKVI